MTFYNKRSVLVTLLFLVSNLQLMFIFRSAPVPHRKFSPIPSYAQKPAKIIDDLILDKNSSVGYVRNGRSGTNGRVDLTSPIFILSIPFTGGISVRNFFSCYGFDVKPLDSLMPYNEKPTVCAYLSNINPESGLCVFGEMVPDLDKIHDKYPTSTIILTSVPRDIWLRRIYARPNFRESLSLCAKEEGFSPSLETDEDWHAWYVNHYEYIINWAKDRPSHALVEVAVLDEGSEAFLEEIFITNELKTEASSKNCGIRDNDQCHDANKAVQLCMIIRTCEGQDVGPILSLLPKSADHPSTEVRAYLMDTGSSSAAFLNELHYWIDDINGQTGRCSAHLLEPPFDPEPSFYGYDATDWALDTLLASGSCTHFLFTNGDNYYLPSLVEEVAKEIEKEKLFIAWDFLTHHPRKDSNVITVRLQRQFIDLGSFVVSASVLVTSDFVAKFMPFGDGTGGDFFARDWHFVKSVTDYIERTHEDKISLIHRVLFSHE